MNIHFIGCLGASMSALADLTRSFGHNVTGSDRNLFGHDPKNIEGKDLVVYTNAVKDDNPELAAARRAKIKTVERAQYLADIAKNYSESVAVAGCHGKSTTTAMTGAALYSLDPTVHVGAADASKIGGTRVFVTEACEYNRSFLKLSPTVAAVLNVAYDHPDCYKTERELEESYARFISNAETAVVNGDDEFLSKFDCLKFGCGGDNFYRAENIATENGLRSFDFYAGKKNSARVELSIHGAHNVYNALAAMSIAHILGVPPSSAAEGVKSFRGIARRFEYRGYAHGKAVYTDYAHHPDEIAATIASARELYDSVTVVFQPHTYSRTAALYKETADSLSAADTVILAPIFAAREKPIVGVSSALIADALLSHGKTATLASSIEDAAKLAALPGDDAVIFTGAGDIDKAADIFTGNAPSND